MMLRRVTRETIIVILVLTSTFSSSGMSNIISMKG